MKINTFLIVISVFTACHEVNRKKFINDQKPTPTSLILLGTSQDAGVPQIGCEKDCCRDAFLNKGKVKKVISLGLIDGKNSKAFLFEATPDMATQIHHLSSYHKGNNKLIDGIFLTHAHIGHYTGLMFLGKEAVDANNISVYVMPRMKQFLTENAPWSMLVGRGNIYLEAMQADVEVHISNEIKVTPFLVPHRDEFSETVGYLIKGPNKRALFIPDIDKWGKWRKNIKEEIKKVDYAFLDATFYSGSELNNRDISQIPHPFIVESMEVLQPLDRINRNKVIFIHFNHTNPVIKDDSQETEEVLRAGYRIGRLGDVFSL